MHRRTVIRPSRHALVPALAALALAAPLLGTPTSAAPADAVVEHSAPGASLALVPLGAYETGLFDEAAAEIVAHYAAAQRLLVVSAAAGTVEVLDVADADDPVKLFDLVTAGVALADGSVIPEGAVANSVAVRADGLTVVAVEAPDKTDPGWLAFFDAAGEGTALGAVRVGSQPDMVTLTADGDRAVVANEAEPAEDYSVDPEGSVSVVGLPDMVAAPTQADVRTAGFHAYEGKRLPRGVRVYGGREDAGTGIPAYPVSENLEPEYITVAGRFAYVTVQEANAIAKVDLRSARVVDLTALGTVARTRVPLDASDEDGAIALRTWPVRSFRLPDAIDSFVVGGRTYLVTANEGDTRDWEGYSEEVRVSDLGQDGLAPVCPSVAARAGMTLDELLSDENLGRLQVTTAQGLRADGACYRTLYAFGGRGISVFDVRGRQVAGTGAQFERILAKAVPDYFNSDHGSTAFDDRSDAKGPEPEGVVTGKRAWSPLRVRGSGAGGRRDVLRPDSSHDAAVRHLRQHPRLRRQRGGRPGSSR